MDGQFRDTQKNSPAFIKSKENFITKLTESLEKLNKNEQVYLIARGAEGPFISFEQNEETVFNIPVFHGQRSDFRQDFMESAEQLLTESGFRVVKASL